MPFVSQGLAFAGPAAQEEKAALKSGKVDKAKFFEDATGGGPQQVPVLTGAGAADMPEHGFKKTVLAGRATAFKWNGEPAQDRRPKR